MAVTVAALMFPARTWAPYPPTYPYVALQLQFKDTPGRAWEGMLSSTRILVPSLLIFVPEL